MRFNSPSKALISIVKHQDNRCICYNQDNTFFQIPTQISCLSSHLVQHYGAYALDSVISHTKFIFQHCRILENYVVQNGRSATLLQRNLLLPSSGLHRTCRWRQQGSLENWCASTRLNSITARKKAFVTVSAITNYILTKFTLPNELTFFTISSSSSFSRGS